MLSTAKLTRVISPRWWCKNISPSLGGTMVILILRKCLLCELVASWSFIDGTCSHSRHTAEVDINTTLLGYRWKNDALIMRCVVN